MIVWSCIGFNLAATCACTMAAVFVCTPVSYAWTQWDGEHLGHCNVSNNNLGLAHGGIGIVMDMVALALPITQIWNLQMSKKKKAGVVLMFSVGTFVTVVSILRLRSLIDFGRTQNLTCMPPVSLLKMRLLISAADDYLDASLWSVIEVEVGIICSCMPSIRLGLARLFPKILGSSIQSSSKPTGAANSHGNTLGTNWSINGIGVTTSVRVSRSMRPQTNDHASFVQLVEIDADQKSSTSKSHRSLEIHAV